MESLVQLSERSSWAYLVNGGEELRVEVVLWRFLQVLQRPLQEQRHLFASHTQIEQHA